MDKISKKLLGFLFAFALMLSIAQPVLSMEIAQADTTKTAQIEELLNLIGSEEQYVQVINLVIGSVKQSYPNVPNEWWERFLAKVDPAELDALVAEIYDRNFTLEEINALVDFNRSAVGQSINAKMPVVTQESFIAGQRWGERLAGEVLQELETDGWESI